MRQARARSFGLMVTQLPCIVHKLVSLKTSTMKYLVASWRARRAVLCIRMSLFLELACKISLTRRWKGAFLMRRSVFFWNFRISLRASVPGRPRWGFLTAIVGFLRPLVPPWWLNAYVGLFPQYIYGLFVWYGPWFFMFMVAGVVLKHAQVVTSLLCV